MTLEIHEKYPAPTRFTFLLSVFLVPWLVLGIEINGLSFYFSFLVAVLDLKFLLTMSARLPTLRIKRPIFIPIILILLLVSQWVAMSPLPLKALIKILGSTYFFAYMYFGLKTYKAQFTLFLSLTIVTLLTIAQFVEANYFARSTILDVTTWRFIVNEFITIGLGGDLGASYADHFLPNLLRVSGSTGEPGHLQSLFITLIPAAAIWNTKMIWKILGTIIFAIVYFMSLSKIGMIFAVILALIGFFAVIHSTWKSFIAWIVLYLIGSITIFGLIPAKNLYDLNVSIFERIDGVRLFSELPWFFQIFGTGYRGVCKILQPATYSIPILSIQKQLICAEGGASFVGSMLLEFGALGLTIFASVGSYFCYKQDWRFTTYVMLLFSGMQAVHFFTFYPSYLFALAFIWSQLFKMERENGTK